MTSSRAARAMPRLPSRRAQGGVVMAITLIALTLLLIVAAAMLRTVDSGSMLAGNMAFRRDMTNRAELVIAAAKAALLTGSLSTETARQGSLATANYSSTRLAATNNPVPDVLTSDSAYTAAAYQCLPVADCSASPGADGIKMRWVIERQCVWPSAPSSTSAPLAFDTSYCEYTPIPPDSSGISGEKKPSAGTRPVYRISVRITGPRGAEAYYQTSYLD